MSEFVVTRQIDGMKHYYAGYQCEGLGDAGPIFNRTITQRARFTEAIADSAVRQLTHMGYAVAKEALAPKRERRKKKDTPPCATPSLPSTEDR